MRLSIARASTAPVAALVEMASGEGLAVRSATGEPVEFVRRFDERMWRLVVGAARFVAGQKAGQAPGSRRVGRCWHRR